MALENINTVFIKVEVEWDGNEERDKESVSETGIFSGQKVKEELIRPKQHLMNDGVSTEDESGVSEITTKIASEPTVKRETVIDQELLPTCKVLTLKEECVVDETVADSLYEGHAVKEELVLGPEVLQPRDSVFALNAQCNQLKKDLEVKTNDHKPKIKVNTEDCREENGFKDTLIEPSTSKDVLNTDIHKAHKIHHKKSIKTKNKFICTKCSATFVRKVNFKRHQELHCSTIKKSFVCNFCDSTFGKNSHYQVHLRMHSGEKPFKCMHCDCAFTENSSLTIHLRTHSGIKPYECYYCGVTFRHKGSLIGHIRTHTKEKPYKCTKCSSAFSLKRGLLDHLRTHTGERPYKCSKCDASFAAASGLRNHRKTCGVKLSDMPFKCAQCPAAFSQHCFLKRHVRCHTGERPYKCTLCDYSSATLNNLKNHVFRHSGLKPFACEECTYRGASKSNLKQHVNKYHKT